MRSFGLFSDLNVNILVEYLAVGIYIQLTRFSVAGAVTGPECLAVSFCHLLIEF